VADDSIYPEKWHHCAAPTRVDIWQNSLRETPKWRPNIHDKEPQEAGAEATAKLRIRRVVPQRAHQNGLDVSARLTFSAYGIRTVKCVFPCPTLGFMKIRQIYKLPVFSLPQKKRERTFKITFEILTTSLRSFGQIVLLLLRLPGNFFKKLIW